MPGVVLGDADRSPTKVGPLPVGELLSIITGAAERVFGDQADRRLAELLAFLRRRVSGDYEVDDYGLDVEFTDRFAMELIRPLATKWFRVEVRGVENIPTDSGALVVANHSGTVPIDGVITMFAVNETTGRHLRPLGAEGAAARLEDEMHILRPIQRRATLPGLRMIETSGSFEIPHQMQFAKLHGDGFTGGQVGFDRLLVPSFLRGSSPAPQNTYHV